MILKDFYKGRPAIKLCDSMLEAVFLPEDGAKLVSLKTKDGNELLAVSPGDKYKRLFIDSDYIKSECSAFDDMFPTIDPCTINGMNYLDHGEVCRREHSFKINGNSVDFECKLTDLNIVYKKTVAIENGVLCIKYRIENRNSFEFPYIWAGHMMFKGEEGAAVIGGFTEKNYPVRVMFGNPPEGKKIGTLYEYGNKQYKYYYTQEISPMKCGIMYPQSKLCVTVETEGDHVKYLGVWMNPGDLNEMYNIALEPCTALYDSPLNAKEAGAESILNAEENVEFTLKIHYDVI